jgi:FKBP-type peptidyl-prolyl cis-trans isomerase
MNQTTQRVFIIIAALLFLVSSLALTIAVVIDANQRSDVAVSEDIDIEQLEQMQNQEGGEPMLQGTKLADFDPVESVDELQIIDIKVGDGQEVKAGDTVTAHYTGAYAVNGEIFESSKDRGEPFTSELNNLIPGWIEGIPGMKVGGVRRLVIPGSLAYGEAPEGYTPGEGGRPLGTLVFDIELIAVE